MGKLPGIFGSTSKLCSRTIKGLVQQLWSKFVNLKFTDCSDVDDYCDKLKAISDKLQDLKFPMDDKRLVIQLVNGLPPEYDTVAALISQTNETIPSFEAARSQLRTEEQRRVHQSSAAPPTALASQEPAVPAAFTAPSQNQAPTPAFTARQAPLRFSNPIGGRHNRSNGRHPSGSTPAGTFGSGLPSPPAVALVAAPLISGYPWHPYWAVPPCPYPTAAAPFWSGPSAPVSRPQISSKGKASHLSNTSQALITPTTEFLKPEDIVE
ncbi:unnamed protein product, partial [Cuscuta europaea]